MLRDREPKGTYEVGYGKPPQHTRFKPGQSGNPKGRKKAVQDVDTMLQAALAGKVNVTENGRSRSMSKLELILNVNVAKAAKGDARSFREIMGLLERIGRYGQAAARSPGVEALFGSEEMAVIARFMARETDTSDAPEPSEAEETVSVDATANNRERSL